MIRPYWKHYNLAIGEGYWTESKAWTNARRNIEAGKAPWIFK